MREIKFRAWDSERGKMNKPEDLCHLDGEMSKQAKSLDFIPMQFTGLLDKNKKEIYEGDILKAVNVYNDEIFIGPIEYQSTSQCRFYLRAKENYHPDIFSISHTSVEVLGNIHENPELLEGQ